MPELPKPARELPPELLENSRIVPTRNHLLPHVKKGGKIAEVGVALGGFTYPILDTCRPEKFYAIDIYTLHTLPELWSRPTTEIFGELTHEDFYRKEFSRQLESGQMEILAGDSVDCLNRLPDQHLDMVYVDAHHTYEAVKRELEVIKRKIKDDGVIILNDYTFLENVGSKAEYGVIQAAHEFMIEEGWEMRFLALAPYMFCDVMLKKV